MGKEPYTGNFCHNDMDMLVVGMHGASNDGFIGSKIGGCTDQEYLTHFALWAIMGSPLIMGCDLRKASEETKKTLLNKDLIAINQDLEARGAYVIKPLPDAYNENEAFILVKPLADGDLAIGIFNFSDTQRELSLEFWDMGIPYAAGVSLSLHDCITGEELGEFTERFAPVVPSHGCVVVRARIGEK